MNSEKNKIKSATVAYALVAIVVAYLSIIGILIYAFGMDNQITQITSRFVPYPAAIIGSKNFIPIKELQDNLRAVRKFYENQDFSDTGLRVDFTTENGQKRLLVKKRELLTKLIENKIIEILANARGINITQDEVTKAVNSEITRYGNDEKELVGNMQKLYGWNTEDFKEKLVKPDLYQAALEQYVSDNDSNAAQAKKKIEAAQRVLNDRKDFSEAVKQYSEGDSVKNGGDLGWFSADQMLPQLSIVAFGLPINKTSDVIESPLGFHIMIIDDKKIEGGIDKVKIRQIFVKKQNFSDWLVQQEKNIKISIPLKEFYWNKEIGEVEFRDAGMKAFEENLNNNSSGDASVLF